MRKNPNNFSSSIIKDILTVDIKSHKPTHASAFLVWCSKPTADVKRVIELGSGTGIVAFSIAKLYNLTVDGIELQSKLFELAVKGIELNKLQEKVNFYNLDIKEVRKYFKSESYDMVVSNLPFHIGKHSSDEIRKISRSADFGTIDHFVRAAFYLLRNKGTFVFVSSPKILVYLLEKLSQQRLITQKMVFFHGNINKPAKLVALRGKKNGGYNLIVEHVTEND
ncbi:MAG: methyltransferase [Fervidobacterium sp.]|nr:methyltransferase [Fervidobacterium sp.]